MQYLLAFYQGEADLATRARGDEAFWRGWREYFAAIDAAGIRVDAAPLDDARRAVTARTGTRGPIVHDGPYAETKEQLAGFVVIDVPSLDDALAWAERCPAARSGAVEVRPVLTSHSCAPETSRMVGQTILFVYETAAEFARREHDAERYWAEWGAVNKAMTDAGVAGEGAPLCGPETATVVRVRDGGRIVHDGPYADTKEQLGGYVRLDLSMDEALHWAARCPAAFTGAMEARPLLQIGAPA